MYSISCELSLFRQFTALALIITLNKQKHTKTYQARQTSWSLYHTNAQTHKQLNPKLKLSDPSALVTCKNWSYECAYDWDWYNCN